MTLSRKLRRKHSSKKGRASKNKRRTKYLRGGVTPSSGSTMTDLVREKIQKLKDAATHNKTTLEEEARRYLQKKESPQKKKSPQKK